MFVIQDLLFKQIIQNKILKYAVLQSWLRFQVKAIKRLDLLHQCEHFATIQNPTTPKLHEITQGTKYSRKGQGLTVPLN